MTKIEMTEAIIAAKQEKGVFWSDIAQSAGLSDVFVTSACLGQNSLEKDAAVQLGGFLGLSDETVQCLQKYPVKAVDVDAVPKDPLIYRFFEIAYVYGLSVKEIIHEKFGDGIMSAIDFTLDVERVEDPKGDRVKVVMNGKFLPYKKW